MRKLKGILVLVLLLALLASPIAVLASDISGAQYYGTIIVSNNSTATTNVAVNCSISTQALIDGGYLNSSANNCVVRSSAGADLPFMPSVNASYPWCIWVPNIGQNTHLADILYTANSSGGKIRYFPTTDGMTTADNATMELGDNFTVEQSGWVDTTYSVNKTLIFKDDAFQTYISGTGNITSEIGDWVSPTGDADPDGAWANETNAYNDNTADFATEAAVPGTSWSSFIILTRAAINCDAIRWWSRSPIPAADQVDVDVFYGGTWQDVYEGVSASEVWVEKGLGGTYSINGTRWRWYNSQGGATDARLHEFDFWETFSVTATGVASGEHTIRTTSYPTLSFDGTNDLVAANTVDDGGFFGGAFTIMVWAKLSDWTGNKTIFSGGKTTTANDYGAIYYIDASDKFNFDIISTAGEGNAVLSTDTFDNDGDWHFFAMTVDADGHINQSIIDTTDYGGDSTWNIDASDFNKFYIGQITFNVANTSPWQGEIRELWVFGRELGASEIEEYRQETYANLTSLEARILMAEGAGATVFDASGNGNDGTITGATWGTTSILQIWVDDIREDFSTGASVPDNANDWSYYENMGNYWDYTEVTVSSTQVQYIDWEYDTIFYDSSGFDNDATPTFRTTSSDPDVSAVLSSFLPIAEAKAPAYALEEAPAFIETVPTIVSEWDVTPPAGTFPLAGVVRAIASATDTPAQLPLLIIAAFVIIACSLAISAAMRRYGSGSLIIKSLVITALMGIFIALGNFGIDFWMLFVFLVIAIALSMGSKQVGWQ